MNILSRFKDSYSKLTPQQQQFSLLVFGAFVFLLLIFVSSLFRRTAPSPSIPPASPDLIPLPTLSNTNLQVSYSSIFSLSQIPESLPIYKARPIQLDAQVLGTQLSQRFKLQRNTSVDNYWSNTDQSYTLYLDRFSDSLIFSISSDKYQVFYVGPYRPTPSSAINQAQNLISSLNLGIELTPVSSRISYLSAQQDEPVAGSSDNYDLIVVPFSQTINGYSAVFHDNNLSAIRMFIGQNNTILKAEIAMHAIEIQPSVRSLPTISLEQVKTIIQNRQAGVLSLSAYPNFPPELREISQITLESGIIEYRLHKVRDTLIPYLQLEGSAVPQNQGSPARIQLLVPLVDLDSLP